jgi:hypothetical protein
MELATAASPKAAAERARKQESLHTGCRRTPDGAARKRCLAGFARSSASCRARDLAEIADLRREFFTAVDDRAQPGVRGIGLRLDEGENREITDMFAAGAAMLLLTGGALSALFFRRVP